MQHNPKTPLQRPRSIGDVSYTQDHHNYRPRSNTAGNVPNSRSKSPSKTNKLLKYMEINEGPSYANDFELEDNDELNLSYSKFSNISGISFIKPPKMNMDINSASGSEYGTNSGSNSGSRTTSSSGSSAGSSVNIKPKPKNSSLSSSPFIKKMKSRISDLEVEEEIPYIPHRRSKSENNVSQIERPPIRHRGNKSMSSSSNFNANENIYPIGELSFNDENESPFIDNPINSPQEILQDVKHYKVRKNPDSDFALNSSYNNDQTQGTHHDNGLNITPKPSSGPLRPSSSNIGNTPKNNERKPLVNVSLTPAQRVEKISGLRMNNILDNFEFLNLVGKGAFANVYKGINLKTNQVVAIKQIELERDQDFKELMGEIDLLKILKHPNIVKYHGFVKTPTSLNVLLEYCSGGSLRQLYKKTNTGIPESEIIKYVELILHGLNYLHEQGVVHRDVKAANVLITKDGDIKLADFGVATKVSSQHHTVVGTPNWMAPETVLGGDGLCTASDIWSLGATIIELFTTKPPYHDLNPMATLHAIGTDDHPPLPKHLSYLAKDFLLECFQKQPNLRTNAKLLLKHKWLNQNQNSSKISPISKNRLSAEITELKKDLKPIKSYSETNDENWDVDFADLKVSQLKQPAYSFPSVHSRNVSETPQTREPGLLEPKKASKKDILNKFSDNNEDLDFENDNSKLVINGDLLPNAEDHSHDNIEEDDPFLELDIENFDTNEIEIQNKMEFLINKFSSKLDNSHSGDDQAATSLIKITGRMLHLVKKYPILHDVVIRDHGILTLLELLENASELVKHQKLWYHSISILNYIFENNVAQFDNFCLLGGIPIITQFRNNSYDIHVRLQVVKFIRLFKNSERALSMFVSSGGLRVLSKFAEEDFDYTPDFPLVAIDCIHDVLSRDLTRFKSDICRMLSKYGVIFWFVVLLNRLTKFHETDETKLTQAQVDSYIDKIIEIIKSFSNAEARVRVNISSTDLYKLLIKVYSKLNFQAQLSILKFFRSMSCIPSLLKTLYSADILEFLVTNLKEFEPPNKHYKEVVNTICPCLFNCCYLNHAREIELVKLGAVPILKRLSKVDLEFKQFVLPILCELVYCDGLVREVLEKHDILSVYFNLVTDPYWQANALDSILHWNQQKPQSIKLDSPIALDCLISGFLLTKVSNLEATLEIYLKLLTTNKLLRKNMNKEIIVNNILTKLRSYHNKPVVQLSLLRILSIFVSTGRKLEHFTNSSMPETIKHTLSTLISGESSVLVGEFVSEIISKL